MSPAASDGSKPCNTAASNTRGTTTLPTSGTAIRLASGASGEAPWKNSTCNGSMPKASSPWARVQLDSSLRCSQPRRASRSRPTAANESQKPALVSAKGSSAASRPRLIVSTLPGDRSRPRKRAPSHRPSISRARCVGSEKPARAA